jgi:hypothetical protein
MAETPDCHTCRMRGVSRPALVRGWHRSRWRLEAACADHAPALARALPLGRPAAPAPAPPWAAAAPRQGASTAPAGLPLPPRPPARPRPVPAPDAAGPPLCSTCLLRGLDRPALVRGWPRSRWRLEAACADHAPALARVLPLAAPTAVAATAGAAGAGFAAPAPSASPPLRPPAPGRRGRRPALVAAGGLVVAGAAAIVAVVAGGSSPAPAPAPALPAANGASLEPAAAPPSVRVPRLVGTPLSRARGSLTGVRLVVSRRHTGAVPAGVILAQRPRPGARVVRGSPLLVTVALPARAVEAAAPSRSPSPAAVSPPAPIARASAPPVAAGASCADGSGWGRAWGAFRCR